MRGSQTGWSLGLQAFFNLECDNYSAFALIEPDPHRVHSTE